MFCGEFFTTRTDYGQPQEGLRKAPMGNALGLDSQVRWKGQEFAASRSDWPAPCLEGGVAD